MRSGTVEIVDAAGRADAGDVLGIDNLVIMGDSYSSARAPTGTSLAPTPTPTRAIAACTPTLLTPLGFAPISFSACSGVLISDLDRPQLGRTVSSQLDQLRAYSNGPTGPPEAIVMTLGGNDAGFKLLALDCILSPSPCDQNIFHD